VVVAIGPDRLKSGTLQPSPRDAVGAAEPIPGRRQPRRLEGAAARSHRVREPAARRSRAAVVEAREPGGGEERRLAERGFSLHRNNPSGKCG